MPGGTVAAPEAEGVAVRQYGGGNLPSDRVATTQMSLRRISTRRVADMRLATFVRCGGRKYQLDLVVPVEDEDGELTADTVEQRTFPRGEKVRFRARVAGTATPSRATGRLTLTARRTGGGLKTLTCRKPGGSRQSFILTRRAKPSTRGGVPPQPNKQLYGFTDQKIGVTRGAVVMRVDPTGKRIAAAWTARARCGGGQPRSNVSYSSPYMTIRITREFRRTETFNLESPIGNARIRARFTGRFTETGASGTVSFTQRFQPRGDRRAYTCRTGSIKWHAGPDPGERAAAR